MDGGTQMTMMTRAQSSGSSNVTSIGMHNYFSSWETFQLNILFSTWTITTAWQFSLSWLAVAMTAVAYHCLERLACSLESGMMELLIIKSKLIDQLDAETAVTKEERGTVDLSDTDTFQSLTPQHHVHRPLGW